MTHAMTARCKNNSAKRNSSSVVDGPAQPRASPDNFESVDKVHQLPSLGELEKDCVKMLPCRGALGCSGQQRVCGLCGSRPLLCSATCMHTTLIRSKVMIRLMRLMWQFSTSVLSHLHAHSIDKEQIIDTADVAVVHFCAQPPACTQH